MKQKIQKSNVQGISELNMTQKGMLFHYLENTDENLYNVQLSFSIEGDLDVNNFKEAFKIVQSKNEVLRSVFSWDKVSKPLQIILKECPFNFIYHDFSIITDKNILELEQRYIDEDQNKRFDLTMLPIRISIIKMSDKLFTFIITHHHILYDGWSTGILLKDLFYCYNKLSNGEELKLVSAPSYKDFQLLQQQNVNLEKENIYWESYLKDIEITSFFTERFSDIISKEPIQKFNISVPIDKMEEFASINKVTKASIIYTAYGILLQQYTDIPDVVFGTAVANRDSAFKDSDKIIGNFINTIPLRLKSVDDKTFLEAVTTINNELINRNQYSNTSYAHIKQLLNLELSENLFDSVVVIENYPLDENFFNSLDDLKIGLKSVYEHIDLPIMVKVFFKEELEIEIVYNSKKINKAFVKTFVSHFIKIINEIVGNVDKKINTLCLLSDNEILQQLSEFNKTKEDLPNELTTIELFKEQAEKTPENVALKYRNTEVSYSQLNDQSDRIASYLMDNEGVEVGDLIGVMLDRDEYLVPVILGILKVGAAYVPIDPSYPSERISTIIEDSKLKVLLTRGKYLSTPINLTSGYVDLDKKIEIINAQSKKSLRSGLSNRNIVYVIYTSGSTGKPKGVMIEDRSLVNYITWASETYVKGEEVSFPLYTSVSFDLTVTSIFTPLTTGNKIIIYNDDENSLLIEKVIADNEVDIVKLTPSHLKIIRDSELVRPLATKRVKKFIVGGEQLEYELANEIYNKFEGNIEIYNEYGPTEATIGCMIYKFNPEDLVSSVPIGVPINNTQIYILNKFLKPIPEGLDGELYISGDGIARGYLHNEGLTIEKFVDNPFIKGERMYRTGDLARRIAKDNIVFVGRIDDQVKIRGFRIELGEIEEKIKSYEEDLCIQTFHEQNKIIEKYNEYVVTCNTCLISEKFPDVTFNEDGVCNKCEDYSLNKESINKYFKEEIDLTTFFKNQETTNNSEYDCLLLFSGGKDSTYTLYKLLEMGLKVLTLTFDNGFISEAAFTNIRKTTSDLNVKSIIRGDSNINKVFLESLKIGDNVCSGCWNALNSVGIKVAEEFGINVIVSGLSRGQIIEMRLEGLIDAGIMDEEEINNNLLLFRETFHSNDNVYYNLLNSQINKTFLSKLNFIDYFRYDPLSTKGIKEYLFKKGWIQPEDTGFCSTNCLINDVGIYIHSYRRGYHFYEAQTSWDCRLNVIDRKQGLEEMDVNVDLKEVDNILTEIGYYDSVKIENVVVCLKESRNTSEYLVAYYVSNREVDKQKLRDYLKEYLPDYMIPNFFVQLEEMPLTVNGKLNKKALPDPEVEANYSFSAPISKEEKLIAKVWSQVLGVEKIGVTDNFFSVGGDSIKSIQISSRLRSEGYEVSVKDILSSNTIKILTSKLKKITSISDQSTIIGKVALTPIQRLFFEEDFTEKQHFNQSVMLNFTGGVTVNVIKDIFEKLQEHHDALRMVYKKEGDEIVQETMNVDLPISIEECNLKGEKDSERLLLQKCNKIQSGIDLEKGPLMKLGLFHLDSGSRLLIVIHHLVVDGVSWRILFEDIEILLKQKENHAELTLPLKTDSFQSWSNVLSEYSKSESFQETKLYWENLLGKEFTPIKRDIPEGNNTLKDNERETFQLSAEDSKLLLTTVHSAFNTQINDILLTALLLGVKKKFGNNTIKIDLEGHGREEIIEGVNVNRTVGWFTSIYPVLLEKQEGSLSGIIKQVKESLRNIPNNGIDYLIGKYVGFEGDSKPNSHSQILFNYLGQFDNGESTYAIASESTGDEVSPEIIQSYDWIINSSVKGGQLEVCLSYSKKQYNKDTISILMDIYKESLLEVINYCKNYGKNELSPSDLTYKKLSISQLDELQVNYDIEDIYTLSPMQEGMLFYSLFDSESKHYFEQRSLSIKGMVNLSAVEKSMNDLVDRYDILRTIFLYEGYERPIQVVLKKRDIDFTFKDIRKECIGSSKEEVLQSYQLIDKSNTFDLRNDTLLRVTLLQLGADEFEFIWSHHHILMDGWCTSIIWNEFKQFYLKNTFNDTLSLPPITKYSQYIDWIEKRSKSGILEYWKNYLSSYERLKALPKKEVSLSETYNVESTYLTINREQTKLLKKTSENLGITMNTIIQFAWAVLLAKYNDVNDVVYGLVVSGRPSEIEGVDSMVGLFINTIPVRLQFDSTDTVEDLLQDSQNKVLESEDFQYHPLSEIQSASDLGRDLFDNIIVFENSFNPKELEGTNTDNKLGFSVSDVQIFEQTNYDLTLVVVPNEEIHIKLDYNSSAYEKRIIEKIPQYLGNIIKQVVSNRKLKISDIEIVSLEEKRYILSQFNNSNVNYPKNETVIDLFEKQAVLTPNLIAIKYGESKITYNDLSKQVNKIAYLLRNNGVKSNKIVGLLMDRSIETVIGMLSILKAGGAYLPIDIDYPDERVDYLIEDSKLEIILTSKEFSNKVHSNAHTLFFEDIDKVSEDSVDLKSINTPSDLCYIIYTSGTTGNPKGVMIEHRNVVRLFFNDSFQFDFNSDDVWTLFHSHCFDFSVWEIYGALLYGGKLIVIPKMVARDTKEYLRILKDENVTILNQTPSAFYNLLIEEQQSLEASLNLRYVIFGGEALSPGKIKAWKDKYPNVKLINMFGITETTVHVTYKEIGTYEIENNISNIGTPIPTLSVYIFDKNQMIVPNGIVGEMYVGGEGVARGYLRNEELTSEKFILNPYNKSERLYRTGDLARVLDSGDIEYLGRIDNQVQLRGFRIELGEIEHLLLSYEEITEVIVSVKENGENKYLVAYYVSEKEIGISELRAYLSDKLPDYMIPSYYVLIEKIPLTSNGKVNKEVLPDPEIKSEVTYVAPQTKEEKLLVEIWSKVLSVKKIGITDNFFSVGGDSIKSIQISSRLRSAGYEISVKDIFTCQHIKELSLKLKKKVRETSQSLVIGKSILTPIQQWFFEGSIKEKAHYNQSVMLNFSEGVDVEFVREIFKKLQEHHDALRMVIKNEGNEIIQQNIGVNLPIFIDEYDLREEKNQSDVLLIKSNTIQSSIDLENGPLIKLGLFHMDGGSRLLIVIHHLIVDGFSWRILFEDIESLYKQLRDNKPLSLPLKTDSFLSWPQQLLEYTKSEKYKNSKSYWETIINKEYSRIKRDNEQGSSSLKDSTRYPFLLSKEETTKLLTGVNAAFNTQINDILLTALLISINKVSGIDKVRIDLEGHGREELYEGIDISRTIGWFTSIYPVILSKHENEFSGIIKQVKETLREIPNNGVDYLIQKYLDSDSNRKSEESSQILFNYLGQFDADIEGNSYTIASEKIDEMISADENIQYDWDISGIIKDGQLEMGLTYCKDQYLTETIITLMESYKEVLVSLIDYCNTYGKVELSPSDLTYNSLTIKQLDELQSRYKIQDIYPLSPMQEGMLFHSLYDLDSAHYFEQMTFKIIGELDLTSVEASINELMNRYDVLRTIFIHDGYERPIQVVLKERRIDVTYKDIRDEILKSSKEDVVKSYQIHDRSQKFDLTKDVLMRLTVLQTTEAEYEFIWSHHHILMDGWCMGIIINEFRELYIQNKTGHKISLPATNPYSTYIKWLSNLNKDIALDYWGKYLESYDQLSSLPKKDISISENIQFNLATEQLIIDKEQTHLLNKVSIENGITINTIIQGAWGILLSKYNNVKDAVFGSVVSGRPAEIAGVESMVGLFINTIPVRVSCKQGDTIGDVLKGIQKNALESEQYQYSPLTEIQSKSDLGRGLLDHILIFENFPISNEIESSEVTNSEDFKVSNVHIHEQTNYDLTIIIIPGDEVQIKIDYNAEVYDKAIITKVSEHLKNIFGYIISNSKILVASIEIISEIEKEQLLYEFNNTQLEFSKDKTINSIFEDTVIERGESTAIEFEGESISYNILNEKSNQLARRIISYGAKKEDKIGIVTPRSIEMIISILGVLKAGCAYVPIDPEYPIDRIKYIVADSDLSLILSASDGQQYYDASEKDIKLIDVTTEDFSNEKKENLICDFLSLNLAYLIYTSGSTGTPKGVMIEHRNVINFIQGITNRINLSSDNTILCLTTISFDIFVLETLLPLLKGMKIVLTNTVDQKESDSLAKLICDQKVDLLQITPLHLKVLLSTSFNQEVLKGIKTIMVGGEAFPMELLTALRKVYKGEIYNMYGPTETTVWSTIQNLTDKKSINIGKPIANTTIRIIDNDNNIQPLGIAGELCIGGMGVGRGYWKNEPLTKEKFIQDIVNTEDLIYKTGDLARWLPNGDIDFLGRKDNQVKIHGFRIELGEIEQQLLKIEGIKETAVVVKEKEGDKYLVAYYVAENETSVLREYLNDKLPYYMVPSLYIYLQEMPLTPNGKLDRKALKNLEIDLNLNYTAPKTIEEKLLVEIWTQVLGVENIGVTDNFFSVGGDSIKSIQISSRLRTKGYEVSVKDILTSNTIKALSLKLKKISTISDQSVITGEVSLTPVQRLLFSEQIEEKHYYNQSVMLNFIGGITKEKVKHIFTKLQEHHDVLRMLFKNEGGKIVQQNIGVDFPVSIDELDLNGEKDQHSTLLLNCNKIQSGIDLETGPLMKLGLFHMDNGSRLLIVINHLVVDGVSWRILLEDINSLYLQIDKKIPLSLPLKTDSFKLWSEQLLKYTKSKGYEKGKNYWNTILNKEFAPIIRDNPLGNNSFKERETISFLLNKEITTGLLLDVNSSFKTQINDILLTALLQSINTKYGCSAVKVDVEGHGRQEIQEGTNVSRTVGWFTSIYPVILENTIGELSGVIKQVKETLRSIPNNGIDYLIQKYLDTEGLMKVEKPSQILFNYLGQFNIDSDSFVIANESKGDEVSSNIIQSHDWNINSSIYEGQLEVHLSYSNEQYSKDTITSLMNIFKEKLIEIIDYCISYGKTELSPSDLTYKELTIAQLDQLQDKYEIEDIYTLSPMQEGMLYHYLIDPDGSHYFEQMICQVKGDLNVSAVEKSINDLMNKYDILRTLFLYEGLERPLQVVLKERKIDFAYFDTQDDILRSSKDEVIQSYQTKDKSRKFDLSKDVLMRLSVLKTEENEFEFIWSHHHVIMDGWCMGIIVNEFRKIYSQNINGQEISYATASPYSQYINWLENRDNEDSINYWKNYLASYESLATLPKKEILLIENISYKLASKQLIIDKRQTQLLNKVSREYGVTTNSIIQGAWGILLSKYNNVNDIVFGSVVSGRPAEIDGVESMVGLFINTIPVRIKHNELDTIGDLLKSIQARALESEQYQYNPLSEIQLLSELGRGLLDHILIFENYPISNEIERNGDLNNEEFKVTNVHIHEQTNYDLTIVIMPGDELVLKFDYNSEIYDNGIIENVVEHFNNIVGHIITNTNKPVSSIEIISEKEKYQLTKDFNNTKEDYPREKTIIDLFEKTVNEKGESAAVVFKGVELSYNLLNEKSNQLARSILNSGVKREDKVGIMMSRSSDMIISILSVLKTGCAYVPIDPEYPIDRIKYIVEDSDLSLLLTDSNSFNRHDIQVKSIDITNGEYLLEQKGNLNCDLLPSNLAYLIYTSGSTGKPKGVMIEHRNVVNFVSGVANKINLIDRNTILCLTTISFDIFVLETILPLLKGLKIVLASEDDQKDGEALVKLIGEQHVDLLQITPSHLKLLLSIEFNQDNLKGIKTLLVGGETFPLNLLTELREKYKGEIYNMYGPTETTVWSTIQNLTFEKDINIGTPISNTTIRIMNNYNNIQPIGIAGELCIGGEGLGRGYWKNEQLTKEKFITDPIDPESLVYRTGDLAKWLPNGNIEFIGRIDDQVKIRGFRIELGEIENQLSKHDKIKETVVIAKERESDKYLLAYYVAEKEIEIAELNSYLLEKLPDYMIPAYYVYVEKMPLTPNGKINKKALPDPDINSGREYVAPANEVEEKLVDIWSEVLNLDKELISTNISFFDLGGHSLKLVLLINKINKHYSIEISVKELFERVSIQDVADYLITFKQIEPGVNDNKETIEITL